MKRRGYRPVDLVVVGVVLLLTLLAWYFDVLPQPPEAGGGMVGLG